MKPSTDKMVEWLAECRDIHREWREWLEGGCEPEMSQRPGEVETVKSVTGDIEHHRLWENRYQAIIDRLKGTA